ncbi:hypothetical protein WA577_007423 [Blastocystis sp. JDR]
MDYCILLTSNLDTRYLNNTTLLKSYLRNQGIPYDEVEASNPANRQLRDALLQVAGQDHGGRAEFPALFIMRSNRNIQFVGNWDKIQLILDSESVPDEILLSTPEVLTMKRYFRNMM